MENAPIPLEGQFPLALRSHPQRAVGQCPDRVRYCCQPWRPIGRSCWARLRRDRDGLLGTIEIGQGTFGWKNARRKKGPHAIVSLALPLAIFALLVILGIHDLTQASCVTGRQTAVYFI